MRSGPRLNEVRSDGSIKAKVRELKNELRLNMAQANVPWDTGRRKNGTVKILRPLRLSLRGATVGECLTHWTRGIRISVRLGGVLWGGGR